VKIDDAELLRDFVTNHSEAAFAGLVEKHFNLVYSAALRMVRDHSLAKDVAQSVFVQLARKAPTIREGNALPGWLYRVTHGQAANAVRAEQTRRRLEMEAMMQAQLDAHAAWGHVESGLEEAMATLSAEEQNLVVLRFFQNRNWRDVSAAVAMSEDTVQRRVGRAIEKLRSFFARKGVAVSGTVLGMAVAANAVQAAPAGLTSGVTATALAQAGAGAPGLLAGLKALFATKSGAVWAVAVASGISVAVLMTTAHHRAPSAETLKRGLVLHFTFDQIESGNHVTDTSGAANHGAAVGAVWARDAKRGGVFQFAPTGQFIRVTNRDSLNPARITLAAWVKTSRQDDIWRLIFGKSWGNGYVLGIGGGQTGTTYRGKAIAEIGMKLNNFKGITSSDQVVTDGQWHHVVATYDGAEERCYVDGVPQQQVARWEGRVPANEHDLTLGINLVDPDPQKNEVGISFGGLIDEPMIWNRALSPEEVAFLFQSQR
jgi:RNA polymerase sigma factor (sigma-70 family)